MASKALTPLTEVRHGIAEREKEFMSVLPAHIDVRRFQRTALTAIQNDPNLLNANRQSLFNALTRAAYDGLLPDKREGALVVFKGQVQWMPMVAGILKKVRQSGQISNWTAHAVFEKDEFDILYGDDDRIHHRPYRDGHPGNVTGAYSIVTFKDGSKSRDYMPWWRIEKAKAVARSANIWNQWPDEMAVKTVLRHHSKLLPQSTDIEAAFERDETLQADLGPQEPQPRPQGRAALAASLEAPAHDPETGEIVEAEATEVESEPAQEQEQPRRPSGGWKGKYERYIRDVEAAESMDDLMQAQAAHATPLQGLKLQQPDLYDKAVAAGKARAEALRSAPADDWADDQDELAMEEE